MLRESDIEVAGGLTRPALGGALLRAGSARLTPRNRLIALGGDSLSRQSLGATSSSVVSIAGGYVFWALFFSGQRVTIDHDHSTAVSGSRLDELIATQLATLMSGPAATVHICSMFNDLNQGRLADAIIIDFGTVLAAARAAGKLLILACCPTKAAWSDATRREHAKVRRYLMSLRPEDGVYTYDVSEPMSDPSGQPGQNPIYCIQAGSPPDQTHTATPGGIVWGKRLAALFNSIFPPASLLTSQDDVYHATDNPYGGWNTNPYMAGSGGSFANGATGVSPDGYTVDTGVTDMTLAGSKVTDADGKTWANLALTGTSANSNPRATLRRSLTGANMVVGGIYEAVCEVWCTKAINLRSFALLIDSNMGGLQQVIAGDGSDLTRGLVPDGEYKGLLRTPKFVCTAAPTTLRLTAMLYANPGQAVDANVRYRNMQLRRIEAYA